LNTEKKSFFLLLAEVRLDFQKTKKKKETLIKLILNFKIYILLIFFIFIY